MSRWRDWVNARMLAWYAFREHLGPFWFALTVFTFILLMNQVARQFQSLAGKGLGAGVILEVFLLSIPLTIAITVPMAVLVATMAAFGRLAGDNEVTAMQANGVGFHQILLPTLGGALLLAGLTVWGNDTLLPDANHRLSQLMQDIQRTKPTVVLQEQRINDPTGLGEYRLLPERINRQTNMMYGVRIFDLTDLQIQRTIIADSGRLDYAPDGEDAVLTLWNGTVHHRDIMTPGEYERLAFTRQRLVIHGVGSRLQRANELAGLRSDREMDLGTLMENVRAEEEKIRSARADVAEEVVKHVALLVDAAPPDTAAPDSVTSALSPEAAALAGALPSFPSDEALSQPLDEARYRVTVVERLSEGVDYAQRQRNKFLVEYHKKFAIPVACLVFVLIGAPIGVRARRGGYGFAMGMSTVVFVFYYLTLTGGENLADRRLLPPWLAMWMSNLVFFALGAWLLRRTARETAGRSLRWPGWLRWPGRGRA